MDVNALSLLKPRIRKDNLLCLANQFDHLVRQIKPQKKYSYRAGDKGQATFLVKHSREQRVVVKISYAKNTKTRSWAAHGSYLQREHAQSENKKGLGFNAVNDDVDLQASLKLWQSAGDERFFKIILSPEGASQLDLQRHSRELMQQVERDLLTPLQWMAIDHNNTEHGHVHILVRGVSEKGEGLTIDPTYINDGFRHRSQEIVTRELGLRTERDVSLARARQIEKSYFTEIDRSLRLRAVDGIVNFSTNIPKSGLSQERRLQDIKRLKFLETLSLAEKIGDKLWRLSPDLEKTLKAMQLSNDIIKSRAQHGLSSIDYPDLLNPTELQASYPILGKIVGMDLKEAGKREKNNRLTYATDNKILTDWDRSLRTKAINNIVSFDNRVPHSPLERQRRLQEIKRLKFLETLQLAEKIGAKRWRLSGELENTLYQFSREQSISSSIVAISDDQITGKVIGMGLDQALHDRRYLLLEGTDGKIHYIRATESIVKARDQFKFKNEDVITLNKKTFTPKAEENSLETPAPITFIQVNNHQSFATLLQQKVSVVDDEVIQYVKLHGKAPVFNASLSPFARDFSRAMAERFNEFDNQGLFVRVDDQSVALSTDFVSRLDNIQHRRFGDFTTWEPHRNKQQKDLTLVGTVVASNDRVLLIEDIRGSYYRIANRDLGIDSGLRVGSEAYFRIHKIPNLEYTNTDERLAQFMSAGGYCAKNHTQQLMSRLGNHDFFLKSKEDVDSFVMAHQRRADSWVKWKFFVVEEGIYRVEPTIVNLKSEMQSHLAALKKQYEQAVKNKPCLFTLLTEKSIKHDERKFVLLDKLLKEVGYPPSNEPSKVAKLLQKRAVLWQSRCVTLNDDFKKQSRRWYSDSQTLEQVGARIKKPFHIIQEKSLQQYSGKIVAMGSLDKHDVPHLLLETDKILLALPMKTEKLRRYTLHQDIALQYRYQPIVQKQKLQHDVSQSLNINKDLSHGEN